MPSDPGVDAADIAYKNCLKAMEGSPYVQPIHIMAFLTKYMSDKAFRKRLVELEDFAVERCTWAAWASSSDEREQSMYDLFYALEISVDAESLTIQS